jgi:hypothetical protein
MTADGGRQTCPRRMSDFGPWDRSEGLDKWTTGHRVGQDAVGLSCSFCGSLNPDRFLELVREGWIVGPTDKSYKAYLGRPRTPEDIAARKAQWLVAELGIAATIRRLGEQDRKTPGQIEADVEEEWQTRQLPLIENGCGQEAKFYYQHLSPEQCQEFIDLANSGRMRIGIPGYFYRLPFFCTYQAHPSTESGS